MAAETAPFPSCASAVGAAFVSHWHSDRTAGFQYLVDLYEEGYQLWYDQALTPTHLWSHELATAINDCSLFIVLVSPVSVEREVVQKELHYALRLGKPVLAVHLQQTNLPAGVQFDLGRTHAVMAYEHDVARVVDLTRASFDAHGVVTATRIQGAIDSAVGSVSEEDEYLDDGLPAEPDEGQPSIVDMFADRVSESEALAASVRRQQAVLSGELALTNGVHDNVLVFYGGGGVGKSGLSRQLERWVTGGLSETADWGPWQIGPVVPIRWDFNDADGDVQYPDLLRVLRQALCNVGHSFRAFDIALAGYLEAVSSHERRGLGLTGRAADGVLGSLQWLAAQLKAGVPDQLDALAVQRLCSRVARGQGPATLARFKLADFLAACERVPHGSQAPELAARLAYLLTQETHYLPRPQRPTLVFFIDHFERVQRRAGRSHEPSLARIVASSPYGLFVVTGRNKLDWADPNRVSLHAAGPRAWPGLADDAYDDPRQHLLGRLSPDDTRALYERHRASDGWLVSDDLIDKLVKRSEGLPIHIEAVLQLARNLHHQHRERELTADDLDHPLPEVVIELIDVLTSAERDAFRGACVLPFFDIDLAAKVAGVRRGDVEGAIRWALVDENRDSTYPYRVHDEVRRLVRQDRHSEGFWGEGDWQLAAQRGLAEAKRLIAEAHKAESEVAEIQALALAIRLAYEWNLSDTGLEKAVTEAPAIGPLEALLPMVNVDTAPDTEAEALIQFIHAYALPFNLAGDRLRALGKSSTPVALTAKRFAAYRLRDVNRFDNALEILRDVIGEYPEEAEYSHYQYAITLRGGRRLRDALDYAELHVPNELRCRRFRMLTDRHLGDFSSDTPSLREEFDRFLRSRRVRLETRTGNYLVDAMRGTADRDEVHAAYEAAVRRRARSDARRCLTALAYFHLADGIAFDQILGQARRGVEDDGSVAGIIPHLLALRAMCTGDPDDARLAYESVRPGPRSVSWIRVEVWLAALGYQLNPAPTQWVIPREQVRMNWLNVADGIIERAKSQLRP